MKLHFGLLVNEREARTAVAQNVSGGLARGARGRETDAGLSRTLDVSEKDLLIPPLPTESP